MSTFKKLRRHESKALRSYWSIHSEAWIRSTVSLKEYCDEHRLDRMTMKRWLTVLETPVPRRRRVEKRPAKVTTTRWPAAGSRAFTAFWLMHIEALRASGLPATEYANAHRLPARKLQVLRRRFTRTPPTQEWRGLLHPSVTPSTTETNLRYELRYDRPSTVPTVAPSEVNLREQLSTGLWISEANSPNTSVDPAEHSAMLRKRRQFTDAQKLSMVAELTDPDVTVASVARRHQVSTSMLFRWRDEFGLAPKHDPLLMTAKVVERPRRGRRKQSHALVLHDLLPKPEGMIAVELPDGRRVFVPAGSDPDVVRKHIAAQEMNR